MSSLLCVPASLREVHVFPDPEDFSSGNQATTFRKNKLRQTGRDRSVTADGPSVLRCQRKGTWRSWPTPEKLCWGTTWAGKQRSGVMACSRGIARSRRHVAKNASWPCALATFPRSEKRKLDSLPSAGNPRESGCAACCRAKDATPCARCTTRARHQASELLPPLAATLSHLTAIPSSLFPSGKESTCRRSAEGGRALAGGFAVSRFS